MKGYCYVAALTLVGTSMATDGEYMPPNTVDCYIWGDPHFVPFATTKSYDNQNIGKQHYVYTNDGNLVIQGQQFQWNDGATSCMNELAVQFCSVRFKISVTEPEWKRIGDDTALPPNYMISSGTHETNKFTILQLPDGSKIQAIFNPAHTDMIYSTMIHLPSDYDDQSKGMCGVKGKADSPNSFVNVPVNNNDVTDATNIVSSDHNGMNLPALEAGADPVYTCPASSGNYEFGNRPKIDVTPNVKTPLIHGTTSPAPTLSQDQTKEIEDSCTALLATVLNSIDSCDRDDIDNDVYADRLDNCKSETEGCFRAQEDANCAQIEDTLKETLKEIIQPECTKAETCWTTCKEAAETELAKHGSCLIDSMDTQIGICKADMLSSKSDTSALITYIQDTCETKTQTATDEHTKGGCRIRQS